MARALNSINTRRRQRLGNDIIYGSGVDGDVTITETTVLEQDMYYNNLTVNAGTNLVTNGFRVFVKGTLTNNGTVGLPAAFAGETGIGTLVGRVKDGTSGVPKSYVYGSSAGGTQVADTALRNLDLVMRGWHINPTDGFRRIEGADDGTLGGSTSGSSGSSGTSGGAGGAGAAGGPASVSGTTAGQDGADGTDGTDGVDGTDGGDGAGGAGGAGGGMVVIMAKTVTGTGTIRSDGSVGDAGTTGTTGTTGADGTAGTAGARGADGQGGTFQIMALVVVGVTPYVPAGQYGCGTQEVCVYVPPSDPGYWQWQYVDADYGTVGEAAPDYAPGSFAFNPRERGDNCSQVPKICYTAEQPSQPITQLQSQDSYFPGGTGGAGGAGGAAGTGGAGGAGGIGETGTTGAEGSVFLITDTTSVPGGMVVGNYTKTIVNT